MAIAPIKLATGPVSWGVDFADSPGNPPWRLVLDEIARSGIGALELGPVGYLPADGDALRELLCERELSAVGTFIFAELHDPARHAAILTEAKRVCGAIAAAGGEVLVLIDRPDRERAATAGRSELAPRLARAEWVAMMDLIDRIEAIAAGYGLRTAFHPHAGSRIEFRDEIERLLEDSAVDLCLDTGHAAFAGIAAESALEEWATRIGHVHLKDVDPEVLDRVVREGLDFWAAVGASVFCPLGEGVVDLEAVIRQLRANGYGGFATIEQDRVPGGGEPLVELERSVAALGSAGL